MVIVNSICDYISQQSRNFILVSKRLLEDSKTLSAGQLNVIENTSANIEHYYDLSPNEMHFLTPPELASDIAQYAISQLPVSESIDFGDPAIGTGVFFSSLLNVVAGNRINSAIGIDINEKRLEETRNRWAHRGLVVKRGDYLDMHILPSRNLILANPPYLRYQKVPTIYRKKLQERASIEMSTEISGQSSLYVYFLILSHAWMREGAIAAWLIPSEFMETNYGYVIRKYLTQKVELIRIHRFNPIKPQFENALVSTAVVVFRNRMSDDNHEVIMSYGGSVLKPEYTECIKIQDLKNEYKWKVPWIKNNRHETEIPQIGDLFTVHRGIATGGNSFFIIERTKARELEIPEIALRPVLPKARSLGTDIIEAEVDGYPNIYPQYCLIDCALSEEEIEKKYRKFHAYLKSASKEIRHGRLVRERKPWYRQEQRKPAPFLCTYMGRGSNNNSPLYFLRNKSNAIVTNTYLMLYPKESMVKLFNEQPNRLDEIFSILKNTKFEDIELNSRVYGGGLHKIEPKELPRVFLYSCPEWLRNVLQKNLLLT